MSQKRINYWLIYLLIVVASTFVFKKIETETTLFQEQLNKYSAWIIYGTIIIMGYKNFVIDPRKKGE